MRIPASTRSLLVAAALLLLAAPAQAVPVYFDGFMGFGVSSSTAANATSQGIVMLSADEILQPVTLGITIPDPEVLALSVSGSPSQATPTTAQSRWTVNNGGTNLQDAWLLFLSTDEFMGFRYPPSDVGMDLLPANWAIFNVADFYYPAVRLGNVGAGGNVQFLFNHVIATELFRVGLTDILPRYGVGIVQNVTAPEPALWTLMALVGVSLATWRRARSRA